MKRVSTQRTWLILIAVSGVLAGHTLAYAAPVAHAHADGSAHLHDSVHAYLPLLAAALVPIAVLGLLMLAIDEARSGEQRIDLGALLAVQAGLFLAQESAERLAAGGAPHEILLDPVLWVGLAAQAAVAGATLLMVRSLAGAVSCRRWRAGTTTRVGPLSIPILLPGPLARAVPTMSASISRRGPPVFA